MRRFTFDNARLSSRDPLDPLEDTESWATNGKASSVKDLVATPSIRWRILKGDGFSVHNDHQALGRDPLDPLEDTESRSYWMGYSGHHWGRDPLDPLEDTESASCIVLKTEKFYRSRPPRSVGGY